MLPCELTAPTVVAVLVRAIERDAWRLVRGSSRVAEADGALDVLVGGGLDAIALLARSLPLVIGGALGVAVVRPGRQR